VAVSAISALLAFAPAALAKTYTPNKTGDSTPNGCSKSNCTLREAVIAANGHSGSDKIVLQAGKTYKLSIPNAAPTGEDLAATGDLDINGSLRIQSNSSDKQATVHAQGIDRVFDVSPVTPANAKFRLLKIRGGTVSAASSNDGGGIEIHSGASKLIKSTVTGNRASDGGGGIDVRGTSSSLSVSRSTIDHNAALDDGGGGILVTQRASLSTTNSTITENSTTKNGGGIRASAAGGATSVSLSSVTVARNVANADGVANEDGGGLSAAPTATMIVRNSIVALNTVVPGGVGPDCDGAFVSQGVNLFTFIDANCTGFLFPPNLLTTNPKLGSLEKNGGPTKTLKLKKGGPAVNEAGSGSPTRDQRGEKRKNPDIGAYERT
jgi:CSLREA domain-containing protein